MKQSFFAYRIEALFLARASGRQLNELESIGVGFAFKVWTSESRFDFRPRAFAMANISEADIFDDATDQLAGMTTDDVLRHSRLLDNEIRVLKVWAAAETHGSCAFF